MKIIIESYKNNKGKDELPMAKMHIEKRTAADFSVQNAQLSVGNIPLRV